MVGGRLEKSFLWDPCHRPRCPNTHSGQQSPSSPDTHSPVISVLTVSSGGSRREGGGLKKRQPWSLSLPPQGSLTFQRAVGSSSVNG